MMIMRMITGIIMKNKRISHKVQSENVLRLDQ